MEKSNQKEIGHEEEYKTQRRRKIYEGLTIASTLVMLGGAGNAIHHVFTTNDQFSSIPKPREVNTLKLGQRTIEQLEERKNNLLTKLYPPYENDATEKLRKFYKDDAEILLIDNAIEEVREDLSEIENSEEVKEYWGKINETHNNWIQGLGWGVGAILLGGIGFVKGLEKYLTSRK